MKHKIDLRSGKERRVANRDVKFPLRDSKGIIIAKDRRVISDRRADGLEVTESNLSQAAFDKHFEKFQKDGS